VRSFLRDRQSSALIESGAPGRRFSRAKARELCHDFRKQMFLFARLLLFFALSLAVAAAEPTFTRDVAPILFNNCSGCHRPGESGPFSLLTFQDAAKHSKQIAEVTSKRIMPPWLPDPAYGHYAGERLLTPEQIKVFSDWAQAGAPEGNPADLPKLPTWPVGWAFGTPDLVVQTPVFNVPADGRDVYRNFVVPVPTTRTQFVAAIDFHPGNPKVAHHAFIMFDRTKGARELDAKDPEPGFPGMDIPSGVESPDGHFLSWQPGKRFLRNPEDMSWRLYPESDLVLQMHMQTSGKPETIQSSVAFYFTDKAPTHFPLKIVLTSYNIDIAAGEKNYVVTNTFKMPVDADVLSILPHAHYLGKDLQGYVILPDGKTNWLIRIPDWNFNWQGDYRLQTPVFAPKGSTLVMRFSYDNSADNPRNPQNPPVRVRYGAQTRDEMAELWVQTLPRNPADYSTLYQAIEQRVLDLGVDFAEYRLRTNPNDAKAHVKIAQVMMARRDLKQAYDHLSAAAQADPNFDEPHYFLGLIARLRNQPAEAIKQFEEAVRLNASNAKAFGNLGLIYLQQRKISLAEKNFMRALELNPNDAISHDGLGIVCFEQRKFGEAEAHFRVAVNLNPEDRSYQSHLEAAKRR
jgi:Flp pilus assembly protein TadD/mono/diheme cytochrome c family protein